MFEMSDCRGLVTKFTKRCTDTHTHICLDMSVFVYYMYVWFIWLVVLIFQNWTSERNLLNKSDIARNIIKQYESLTNTFDWKTYVVQINIWNISTTIWNSDQNYLFWMYIKLFKDYSRHKESAGLTLVRCVEWFSKIQYPKVWKDENKSWGNVLKAILIFN